MGTSDRSLRSVAQPFIGNVFGYNRSEQSDQLVDTASAYGDLANLANATVVTIGSITGVPAQDNIVRIMRPKSGQIIDAHFTLALRTATAETNPYIKLSVYKVQSGTDFTRLTPTEAQISACMKTLTGADVPFSAAAGQMISIDTLNILPLIPQGTLDLDHDGSVGALELSTALSNGTFTTANSQFIEDCFTIGVHFYASNGATRATPLNSTGYKLFKFVVEMSAQVY